MGSTTKTFQISLIGKPEHDWLSAGEALSHVIWNNPDLKELCATLQRKNVELLDGYVDPVDPPSETTLHLREVQSVLGLLMEYLPTNELDARIDQAFEAELDADQLNIALDDLRLHQVVLGGLYEEMRATTDRPLSPQTDAHRG